MVRFGRQVAIADDTLFYWDVNMGHRGRLSFGGNPNTFFVTTTVMNFARIFALGEQYYEILRDSLVYVLEKHRARLFAYVFMPSHVHFIVDMPEGQLLSDFMRDFKKYTSTRIRQQLEADGYEDWIEELRGNAAGRKHIFKLWMDRFDDVVIASEEMLIVKLEYIHDNPSRAGLVREPEAWPYSSAQNYSIGDHSFLRVHTDW